MSNNHPTRREIIKLAATTFCVSVLPYNFLLAATANNESQLTKLDLMLSQLTNRISVAFNLPDSLLIAIMRQESTYPKIGQPWPWTIRSGSESLFFPNFTKAKAKLVQLTDSFSTDDSAKGVSKSWISVDIGLCQINAFYQYKRFGNLFPTATFTDLLLPEYNLTVAGQFLQELYQRYGNWDNTLQAYHTGKINTPRGIGYMQRVNNYMTELR